ncbi:uncharacterized protein DEA37_0000585, partial [Paragonimus westermani]
IHMKTNMEYELHLTSTVKEKDQLNELQAESYRITEAITLLSELASRDKEKMNGLLQQLRLWNRQQPTNIMGKCSPPASSSGEILTSSGSEISGTELSETESEIISEVAYESSKVTHFTKEYHPNMTYVLPAIFTYDEQSLSDEIGFSGEVSSREVPPSRFAEDDYFGSRALHKWRFEKESVEDVETTETESVDSDLPAHYISTKHLPMGMTLDSDLALQSGTKPFFKSRKQINTTDMDSSYSVVYIEVARSDPAMQGELLGENLRADQLSKEVQVDQRVLTPRVRKIVELREEEEEAESSVLKQQKRTKVIPVRIKKQEASTQVQCAHTDIAVDVRPCRREAASMISDKDEIAECYQLVHIPHISSTLTPTIMEHPEGRDINVIPKRKDPRFPLMVTGAFYHISTQDSVETRSTYRTERKTPEKVHRHTQTDIRKMLRTFVEVEKRPSEKQGTQKSTTSKASQTESIETHEENKQGTEAEHSGLRREDHKLRRNTGTRERAVTTMRHKMKYTGGKEDEGSGKEEIPERAVKCSLCGQRVPSTPDRPSEAAVPVPVAGADRPALTDFGIGSDVAFPDSVEQGVGVVTVRRVDGTMQTRPVVAFYVDAEGAMVGVKVDGLGVTAADGVPTIRIPSVTDSKSGVSTDSIAAGPEQRTVGDLRPVELRLASEPELIDACCSGSTAEWVDSQLAVQSAQVLLKGFGVQTDARVGPVHADRMVDRATMSVSESVGDYGSLSAWTQTREEAEQERRVPEESVSVGVRDRMRPASVQASLIAVPVVEAAQHVLLQMASDVSQTVDVHGGDRVPLRLTDVEVSYVCPVGDGAERIVSATAAPKPVAISPPVIEASTMSMQSAVAPTPSRPGQCSLCGQRVPITAALPVGGAHCVSSSSAFFPLSVERPFSSNFGVDVEFPCSASVVASAYHLFSSPNRVSLHSVVSSSSFSVMSPSAVEPAHCKHFASQFSFHPNQLDVYSQTIFTRSDCSCETETFGLVSSSTSCDDLPGSMRVLFQNLSITDYRDRLVEHHYYAPNRESSLVVDCATHFSGPATIFDDFEDSISELLRVRQRLWDYFPLDVYNAGVDFGVFAEKACGTDSFVEEVVPTDRMELRAQLPRAECSKDVSMQTTGCVDLQLFLSQFDVTEVWEAVRSVTSDYDYYQTLRQSSIVREQTCTTDEELTSLADIGIQVDIAGFTVRESSSSPDMYSGASEVESINYETYLLRSRLGQVREEQTYVAPLVNQASTQTEASSFSLFSEFKSEGGVYESTETYDYRLLRDEIAEAWTQWDTDFGANEMDDLNREDADNLTEESYLEIINKRRKKVYSQVEITEETDLVVCELGVQVDPDYFAGDTADNWLMMKHVQQVNQELQTDPIHLNSIHHSTDLSWADPS